MQNSLVSIVIPCYNAEKYIRKALQSIVEQTYRNIEVLVADDCSTDNTLKIIKSFADNDKRIRIIEHSHNKKIVQTLNELIQIANGKYIARMDADDISKSDRIEKQVDFLKSHPDIDGCGTNAWLIDINGKVIDESHLPCSIDDNVFFIKYYNTYYHPTMMIKSDIYKKQPYDEDFLYAEDYELWCRMLFIENCNLVNMKEKLFYYRVFNMPVSSKNPTLQWMLSSKTLEKYHVVSDIESHVEVLFLRKSDKCTLECKNYIINIHTILKMKNLSYAVPVEEKIMFYLFQKKAYLLFCKLLFSKVGILSFAHILNKRKERICTQANTTFE